MKFRVIYQQPSPNAQSPIRLVEQATGREVAWINRYLDREYVRRVADRTLRTYAHNLLHFVRWWESIHHAGDIVPADLSESTLLDYVRFQSSQQPRPASSTINDRRHRRRSRPPSLIPRSSLSGRSRVSSGFFAPQAHGPGPPAAGPEPVAREGA